MKINGDRNGASRRGWIDLIPLGESRGGFNARRACGHPEDRREVVDELAYIGAFAYPGCEPDPRARGGHRVVVACLDCGHVRQENRLGDFTEAAPWQRPTRAAELVGAR